MIIEENRCPKCNGIDIEYINQQFDDDGVVLGTCKCKNPDCKVEYQEAFVPKFIGVYIGEDFIDKTDDSLNK